MKTNFIAILTFALISASCAYAACDKVQGVCRLNDLSKISKIETDKRPLPQTRNNDYDSIKINSKKPGVIEFIKSLLKPSK